MSTRVFGNRGWGFDFRQDLLDVTSSLPTIDPAWVGTCPQGHPHAWQTIRDTATGQRSGVYWCEDCRDEHDDFLGWFCNKCGSEVDVGTLAAFTPQYIPGLRSLSVWVTMPTGQKLTIDGLPPSMQEWVVEHAETASVGEVLAEMERSGLALNFRT